ncbi:methyltransferase domain-containing protein [Hyphobacterium marinum]|uniref:Methyltransferase domain-containing protein n=1 Tax=Hyphobacterium marinum TaxID=3116574 RepID=A0ABU7LY31_9PROT|nr:methyltransferase domain-containing protein [Hyphobacterium sp. Y6023]MEE2566471.1 methyltransferase domain-containing protein [Hyphobacterium sp. Y6023]
MRSDKSKPQNAAQGSVDEDMLLQHIAALNAKLTVTFEKKIEPLGNQIIAYREVVAPLSQDLKRNLAILTPLLQQIQTLETAVASARESFGQNSESISQELTAARSEISAALNAIETAAQSLSTTAEGPIEQLRQDLGNRLSETAAGIESAVERILSEKGGEDRAAALEEAVSRLEAFQTERTGELSDRLQAANGLLESLGAQVSSLESRSDAAELKSQMEQLQSAIETKLAALGDSGDLKSQLEQVQSAIEAKLAALGDGGDLKSQLEQVQTAIDDRLSSLVDSAAARLESHQADSAGQVVQYLGSLSQRIDAAAALLESGQSSQAAQTGQTTQSLAAVEEKLGTLEERLGSLFGDSIDAQLTTLKGELETFRSEASSSLEAAAQSIRDSDSAELLRATLSAEISRVELALEQKTSQFTESVEAVKYALQTDMSAAYKSWNASLAQLHGAIESLSSRVDSMAEAATASPVVEPEETVYQPVADSNLPDIIRDRVDEVHTRLTNSDWAIQAIGKNMTSLMHEVASMRDDVLSASMARRTYNAVEDIRVLIEDLPKRGGSGAQSEDLAAKLEDTIESVRTAISARPDDVIHTLEAAKAEILDTLNQTSGGLNGPLEESRREIVAAINALQSINNEIGSQIGQSIASHSRDIMRQLEQHLSPKPAEPVAGPEQPTALAAIEAAALQKMAWTKPFTGKSPAPLEGYDGDMALDMLKEHDPVTFNHWHTAFEAGSKAYAQSRTDNCSTWERQLTRRFRDYLSLFANGPILDIGCGPHATPAYLDGYPSAQVTGLEPLPLLEEPRFPVVRGVSEFLPWPDASFGTVVNATAIDHVMDLEKALEETHRVLKADGLFVLWYADVAGTEDYTAKAPKDRAPVDDFHLFHVSSDWFDPVIARWFDVVDLRRFQADDRVSDVFAVYRPRESVRQTSNRPVGASDGAAKRSNRTPSPSRTGQKRSAASGKKTKATSTKRKTGGRKTAKNA